MSDFYINASFIYSEKVPGWTRNKMEQAFTLARKYALELFDQNYRRWNAEYEGPQYGGIDYNAYIIDRKNQALDTFNYMWGGPVQLFVDETGEIAGRFIKKGFGKETTVTMHMITRPYPVRKLYDVFNDR